MPSVWRASTNRERPRDEPRLPSPTWRGRETNRAFPAPTGRNVKAQGIALGMFRKKRTKLCKGETHAVKFQAEVLGQKPPIYYAPTGLAIVL